ncbi:uncharacterized protein [Haliotis asinina]|uniref:uncharacterized protein n=1 Tax=Haliotis asinina TaxID=109174 RepID=UPI0035318F2D
MAVLESLSALLLLATYCISWDPDAGLVPSLTKQQGALPNATSKYHDAFFINDGNDSTHWTSGGCLPSAYIVNGYLNVLKGRCSNEVCSSSSHDAKLSDVTDGSMYTGASISPINGTAVFDLALKKPVKVKYVSIRGVFFGDTFLEIWEGNRTVFTKTLGLADKYKTETFNVSQLTLGKIRVKSANKFTLTEIDALGESGCTERAWVDLGTVKTIGVIRTRHWAGSATLESRLLTSLDGKMWNEVAKLQPGALRAVFTKLDAPAQTRFIAVEHHIAESKYAKAYVFEIDAWDSHGQWGVPPRGSPNKASLRDMFGVNGIWGWGNNKYSSLLDDKSGPRLYNDIASHARNYHNLGWDVKDPDNDPGYVNMTAGHGTNGEWWLNWDTEYKAWANANLSVDASVQFTSKGGFPPSVWGDAFHDGFRYGKEFASHFGPTIGNGLIQAMEVGNEPWDYPADFYAKILDGMSRGVKSVDKNLLVLPGAFQAHDMFHASNYIGTRVLQPFASNIDVVNGHFYSFMVRSDGVRVMTHPEDLESEFNAVTNLLRWRDVNMPGKPVWITEWGWDSETPGERCRYTECVTEDAQALYGLRGLLILARMGIQKATWFFYADSKTCDNHIFCRSGLTSSALHGFTKKKVFHSFHALMTTLGDKHFLKVLKENSHLYVYIFGDVDNGKAGLWATDVVAWRPVTADDTKPYQASFRLPTKPLSAWRISTKDGVPVPAGFTHASERVTFDATPEVVIFKLPGFPVSEHVQIIG